MRRMRRGFTIIELLVVVSVIGILSTISFTGFNRYQADARDSQRQSQATLISEALEKYYDHNGEYPACPAMTAAAASVTTTTLPGLDPKALVTPQDPTVEDNSIKCQDLTGSGASDIFAYVGDGSSICATGNSCLAFTLKYKQEVTGTVASINSRRQANLLTSGDITDLTATTYSFSKVNLTWSAVSGAATYNVRYSLSSSMSSPTSFTPASTNSTQVTGLTLGTTYYFQVQPVATGGGTGNWSNVSSATTFTLDTPDGTAIDDPAALPSQLKLTWPAIANATSYTVVYNSTGTLDGSGVLTSPTTVAGATSPYVLSGLTAGSTRYFQIKANAAGYSSGYSSVDSATTQVPVPTGLAATTNSSTQITANWNTVSVATSYTLDYSTDSSFASPAPTTTLTSTSGKITGIAQSGTPSRAVTGLQQGTKIYFRVYALVGATSSFASSSVNATTTVNTPGAPGIQGITPETVRSTSAPDWFPGTLFQSGAGNYYFSYGQITSSSCPAGSYAVYSFSAHYSAKPSGAPQDYYTGATTTGTWYVERPLSGYTVTFSANYYCQGPNAASGYGGTNSATAGH